uniref:L1 transposable element RRM domain-containing protein n=1 Tax=Pygocentrus nattereri TaxID=42514 RepID=A0AAR2JW36_PYGNA
MAKNLRQFTYTGRNIANRPSASGDAQATPRVKTSVMAEMKAEILSSLKEDITTLLRSELKSVLADEFAGMKSELRAVKEEVIGSVAALRADVDSVKQTVAGMEYSLSTCSDDITTLQTTVHKLSKDVAGLQEKCVDLEGRMRRSNIRILNVTEGPGSSSPAAVSKLLKEALRLEKEVVVDRSHRGLQLRQQGGKPRAIVAQLHYYQDCVDILRRAREAGSLQYNGTKIFIFPDYPPSVARARSAFNEVKNILRGQKGTRFGMFYPARLRITHNGTEKEFQDPAEAMAYVRANMVQTG